MSSIKSVSIIGSGNVATHMAIALYSTGIDVASIYSRNLGHAKLLADMVSAKYVDVIEDIRHDSDLYLFSVSDRAIESLASKLYLNVGKNVLVAHTSGMLTSGIFSDYFTSFGSFYPLQTFKKSRAVNMKEVPFLITANDSGAKKKLYDLARKISDNVNILDDEKRKVLHVAAVFANNFTNYMYRISENIVDRENLDFDLLKPLIKETAMKILDGQDPNKVQTGPAIRNDLNTIKAHLDYLDIDYTAKKVYELLTESIISTK